MIRPARIPCPSLTLVIGLTVLTASVGCGQPTEEPPRKKSVDAPGVDATVEPSSTLSFEWGPVVAAVTQLTGVLLRAGALLETTLVQDLAGCCRLEGWNQARTIGYRERGWGLQRRSGPGRTRRLVLTFDDGPMIKKTPKILDLLARHKVKAAFFVVGRVIHAGSYRLIRRILKEGHTLANHSYHHLVDMHKHAEAAALVEAELELSQAMVDLALLAKSWRDFRKLRIRMLGGKKFSFARTLPGVWPAIRKRWQAILAERSPTGQSPHRMVFVRPPGGAPFSTRWRRHHRQQYARILRKLGLINVMWDEDSGDSDRMLTAKERRDSDRLVEAIREGTKRGGVFLMHDRIGLGGFGQALSLLKSSKRLTLIGLPTAAQAWYGCKPRTLSLVLQILHALDYRAPAPPVVAKPKVSKPKRMRTKARRRRRRRIRRRVMRRRRRHRVRKRRRAPRRRRMRQGLSPRRR